MLRNIRCHLEQLCMRFRLRGFRRRSLESRITFTVAETRQSESHAAEEQGRGKQSGRGRRKREQVRERNPESRITFRVAEARQENSIPWEEQGRGKQSIDGAREAEQAKERSPESKITFGVAARRQKEALVLEEQGKGQQSSDGRRKTEQVEENFAEIELQRSRRVTERSSDGERRGRIRLATFNVALFSLAPAVPSHRIARFAAPSSSECPSQTDLPSSSAPSRSFPASYRRSTRADQQTPQAASRRLPPSSLRPAIKAKPLQSSSASFAIRPRARLMQSWSSRIAARQMRLVQKWSSRMATRRISSLRLAAGESEASTSASRAPIDQEEGLSQQGGARAGQSWQDEARTLMGGGATQKTVLDVLREADADVVALQEVRAEEGEGMRPLSELAEELGMGYAFAESWAPQFGNAILSRWPIKSWQVQKLPDDSDYRNVLKVVIDVPTAGELHFCCTHLDHLDEDARLKQVLALTEFKAMRSSPHILAGDLNALDPSDYSRSRWDDIAKMRESNGKTPPRGDVMRFLKQKGYKDSKNCAGQGDSVVVLPRGQGIEGTCKSGTRIDYILASASLPYRFVGGSYAMVSSKGTSHHHLVKVDIQPT